MDNSLIYLLLGSNIGDKISHLHRARKLIDWHIGTISKCSQIYRTEPWGIREQDYFLNQAISLHCELSPMQLMLELQRIERYLGKEKEEKYGPRIIDIDILLYGGKIIQMPTLEIPHPRMCDRNFVLTPLDEIASDVIHPVKNLTIHELKNVCIDKGGVSLLEGL